MSRVSRLALGPVEPTPGWSAQRKAWGDGFAVARRLEDSLKIFVDAVREHARHTQLVYVKRSLRHQIGSEWKSLMFQPQARSERRHPAAASGPHKVHGTELRYRARGHTKQQPGQGDAPGAHSRRLAGGAGCGMAVGRTAPRLPKAACGHGQAMTRAGRLTQGRILGRLSDYSLTAARLDWPVCCDGWRQPRSQPSTDGVAHNCHPQAAAAQPISASYRTLLLTRRRSPLTTQDCQHDKIWPLVVLIGSLPLRARAA